MPEFLGLDKATTGDGGGRGLRTEPLINKSLEVTKEEQGSLQMIHRSSWRTAGNR